MTIFNHVCMSAKNLAWALFRRKIGLIWAKKIEEQWIDVDCPLILLGALWFPTVGMIHCCWSHRFTMLLMFQSHESDLGHLIIRKALHFLKFSCCLCWQVWYCLTKDLTLYSNPCQWISFIEISHYLSYKHAQCNISSKLMWYYCIAPYDWSVITWKPHIFFSNMWRIAYHCIKKRRVRPK